jgi:uncharacterized damage-inducible protein DinB
VDLLDRLLEHDRWATSQLLEKCQPLSDAQLDEEFDIGHCTLRITIEHLVFNIEAWSALMLAEPMETPSADRSLAALTSRYERADDAFMALARRLRDEGRLDETFTDAYDGELRFGAGIVHVVLHNEGHRVEIIHILARLGQPEIEVDHALWDFVDRGLFEG